MCKVLDVLRVRPVVTRLHELLSAARAIGYAVAHLREGSLVRRAKVGLQLLAIARADRYEISSLYLETHVIWRTRDGAPQAASLAEAVPDEDVGGGPFAIFTLHTSGADVEWTGPAARGLLALGRLAGIREDSPYDSYRFDFELREDDYVEVE
jgi:hypothetical protein